MGSDNVIPAKAP